MSGAEHLRAKHRREVVVPGQAEGRVVAVGHTSPIGNWSAGSPAVSSSRELRPSAGILLRVNTRAAVDPVVELHCIWKSFMQDPPVPLGTVVVGKGWDTEHTPVQEDAKLGLIEPGWAGP